MYECTFFLKTVVSIQSVLLPNYIFQELFWRQDLNNSSLINVQENIHGLIPHLHTLDRRTQIVMNISSSVLFVVYVISLFTFVYTSRVYLRSRQNCSESEFRCKYLLVPERCLFPSCVKLSEIFQIVKQFLRSHRNCMLLDPSLFKGIKIKVACA